MSIQFNQDMYGDISQRVISSFCRGIAAFKPMAKSEREADSRRNLHEFFTALYTMMYKNPARFGMPASADDRLLNDAEGSERKQEVTKKLKKPREIMDAAIALLRGHENQGQSASPDRVLGAP